jgi:3-oxoacyl-[acyl-carrier protein] reductase
MGKLANNAAVVAGASKGIGAGIGKHFAAEGASVVVNCSTSKEVDAITKSLAKDSRCGKSA